MTPAEQLKNTLKKMAGKNVPIQTFWASVVSVDWSKKIADVKDLSADLEVFDVLLGLGGDFLKPKKGSNCLCGVIENKEAAVFIIYAEEVEERWINGDGNGGLAIVPELVSQLNKNNAIINAFFQVLSTPIPEAGNGSVSAFQAACNSALSALPVGDFSAIENEKVKHG